MSIREGQAAEAGTVVARDVEVPRQLEPALLLAAVERTRVVEHLAEQDK